jgi:hypothetical protein
MHRKMLFSRHARPLFPAYFGWQAGGITWCNEVNCCDAKRRLAGFDTRFVVRAAVGRKLSKACAARGVAFHQQKTAGLAGGWYRMAGVAMPFLLHQNDWL